VIYILKVLLFIVTNNSLQKDYNQEFHHRNDHFGHFSFGLIE